LFWSKGEKKSGEGFGRRRGGRKGGEFSTFFGTWKSIFWG